MPTKNCAGKFGKRYIPLSLKLWRRLQIETGIDIDFKTFSKIINTNSFNMAKAVMSDSEGLKLPAQLGYIVVTKYKPRKGGKKRIPIDFKNTNRLGKFVPLLNLHSFGYVYNIRWYRIGSMVKNLFYFCLDKSRPLKRGLAKNIKGGMQFFQWSSSDLWNVSKLDRRFNKVYKKEENGINIG